MVAVHVNTSLSWGGLEQYTVYMMELFRDAGVNVSLMCVPQSRIHNHAVELGFATIPAVRGKHVNLRNILRLRKSLRGQRDVVVHSHTRIDVWLASLACMGTRVPHVHSVHMIPVNKRDPLHAVIYGRVDATVNTSETHVQSIGRLFPVKPGSVHLIRHMRSPALFQFNAEARRKYRAEWNIANDTLVVGYVARIDPLKGTREFAESIEHLIEEHRKRVRLVVIGEPSMKGQGADGTSIPETASEQLAQWLQGRAADPRNQLIVRPFTTDVPGVMSAFDVFVLATYGEMYALTVLEAMMVGIPVIGTNTDGTPDQLAKGRGVLVESRSSAAIAHGIEIVLGDEDQRRQMASRAHEWAVREFDPANVLPQWLKLYHDVLEIRNRT